MSSDFHAHPYTIETETKLNLFRLYLTEWLPVFLVGKYAPSQLFVVDFMAGPGVDLYGTPGSPCIILDVLSQYSAKVDAYPGTITVVLNEMANWKYKKRWNSYRKISVKP